MAKKYSKKMAKDRDKNRGHYGYKGMEYGLIKEDHSKAANLPTDVKDIYMKKYGYSNHKVKDLYYGVTKQLESDYKEFMKNMSDSKY